MVIDHRQMEFNWQQAFMRRIEEACTKLENEVELAVYGDKNEHQRNQ